MNSLTKICSTSKFFSFSPSSLLSLSAKPSLFGQFGHHCVGAKSIGTSSVVFGQQQDLGDFVIWNVLEGNKIQLSARQSGILSWYSCGPTVYDSAHIGHASSYIRQDVIRRIIEAFCPHVSLVQIMGVTDVDDKIFKRARERNIPWNLLSRKYEEEFFSDLDLLNVKPPHLKVRVSEFIPQIIHFIQELLKTDFAYITSDDSVYFNTAKLGGNYRKLRKESPGEDEFTTLTELSKNSEKKSLKDFALWKGAKPGEPFWPVPWSSKGGRPGWHIECSAMATHYFGTSLDIHSGGHDLLFPHHENEEAQCCARFNLENWVTHWIHTGSMLVPGRSKMSKSLGNTIPIRTFLAEHNSGADILRMICISQKYSKTIDYQPEVVTRAQMLLQKFRDFISDTNSILNGSRSVGMKNSATNLADSLTFSKQKLREALQDDFDTPLAIDILTNFMNEFNSSLIAPSSSTSTTATAESLNVDMNVVLCSRLLAQDFLQLLGFDVKFGSAEARSNSSEESKIFNPVIDELLQFRTRVRDFSLASNEADKKARKVKIEERSGLIEACDRVRSNLEHFGIQIKDHHGGKSSWTFKS